MLVASVSTDGLSVRSTDRLILGLIYLKTIDVGNVPRRIRNSYEGS
jgi:hypothetical protein